MHCIVEGRVQGVFFRAATQEQAKKSGLTGFARNRSDGSVEVLVCGEESAVTRLCEWLKQGPPAAQVEEVSCQLNDLLEPAGFSIADSGRQQLRGGFDMFFEIRDGTVHSQTKTNKGGDFRFNR